MVLSLAHIECIIKKLTNNAPECSYDKYNLLLN